MQVEEFETKLIREYLSKLRVETTLAGFNRVAADWRDIGYVPDYNKFYFIVSGEGLLEVGGEEFRPEAGELILMPQGTPQSYSYLDGELFTKHWCHFRAKIGDANLFDLLKVPLRVRPADPARLAALFLALREGRSRPDIGGALAEQSAMLDLIREFLVSCPPGSVRLSKKEGFGQLHSALDFIDRNFKRDLRVEDLADLVHLNQHYFIRLFKKRMGMSPMRYLNDRRIAETKRLLVHTDLPMKEIIGEVGLNDVYYLSRLFKEHTGFSPTAYRRLAGEAAPD